ncbi:dTDP-4-dehydrorhamnose 3,5-epimerase [Campylobacter sp. LR291e]|uniref:dTDP-4-dehydrorhamnose 3,5-epimerase family protein n=1 Tax=Campylobacter sp. LR291e TaxID=2593546 RepID=UPI00123BDD8B|nr:dTDP-4-dehydrorhamnose 3,5-epimerase family protein [Campylobacter sp. LR291e]KAA6233461.1 dTDP-4-dehydrorhamnose 3,5-epimerase [Campylobacter sp. LR291e]
MAICFDIKESKIISGVYIISPSKFKDLRGEIWTAYNDDLDSLLPSDIHFKHDKFITSSYNVLRGIHYDDKTYKLVTCIHGELIQVVVDLRKNSPSYLKYEKFVVNPCNQLLILLPPNVGNAHYISSKNGGVYYYKLAYNGEYCDAPNQQTLAYNDKKVNIDWGDISPILSDRDKLNKG